MEVLVSATRRELRQDMAILDLDRRAVFIVHDDQVENVDALIDVQRPGNLATSMLPRVAQHVACVSATATRNFVGYVVDFEYM